MSEVPFMDLHVRDVEVEIKGSDYAILMDMSSNLRVKNKHSNTYADALEFQEKGKEQFRSLQIQDDQIIERFEKREAENANSTWKLSVNIGIEKYEYDVTARVDGDSLWLHRA